jgi:type I restriction enzyme S subunit
MPLPIPQPEELIAIVRFLDYADRRIRRYIRAKQKLIKLLEEQKQAIIHRAVTRGLEPNVRLKPSGVEWLGDVLNGVMLLKPRSVLIVTVFDALSIFGQQLFAIGDAHGVLVPLRVGH